MRPGFRRIDWASEELRRLHAEMLQLEGRIEHLRESVRKAISDLFGEERPAFPALQEDALVRRIADAVIARLQVEPKPSPTARKQHVREKEAAE